MTSRHTGKERYMLLKRTVLAAFVMITILGGILGGCNSAATETTGNSTLTATATTISAKTWYQKVANELRALQPLDAPNNLKPADGTKNGTEFDVNTYFSALTHLSMQEGYVLDYVYLSDGAGGGPILYIRQADAAPFKNYDEYKAATHESPKQANDKSMIWLVKDAAAGPFGNKISTDGTKEGYFEYALLQIIANRFYLFGRTLVGDRRIVCEKAEIENILKGLENSQTIILDDKSKDAIRDIDVDPSVKIDDTVVTVSFVIYSDYNGFVRNTLTMYKDYPNLITAQKETVLVGFSQTQ